jgi:hypothetical protein
VDDGCAEVVYKNMNVWADLSGLVVGDAEAFTAEERQEAERDVIEGVRLRARRTAEPGFPYGTDWRYVDDGVPRSRPRCRAGGVPRSRLRGQRAFLFRI